MLLDCFRPGTCEQLGIGPDDCAAVNPRLIFARITGWGQDGPLAQTAGHDINYLSQTGALSAISALRNERESFLLDGGAPVLPHVRDFRRPVHGGRCDRAAVLCAAARRFGFSPDDVPNQFDIAAYPEMRKAFAGRFASKARDEWTGSLPAPTRASLPCSRGPRRRATSICGRGQPLCGPTALTRLRPRRRSRGCRLGRSARQRRPPRRSTRSAGSGLAAESGARGRFGYYRSQCGSKSIAGNRRRRTA